MLAAALGLHHGLGITLSNDMIPKTQDGWLDAAFGLTGSPINYPLNFLRDLVALMIVAPLLGWFLRKLGYELAPLILAFVLAPLLEQSLRQSLVMSPDGWAIFVQRPVTVGLLAISALILAAIVVGRLKQTKTTTGGTP